MNNQNSFNRNSPPWAWAWLAAILTLTILFLVKVDSHRHSSVEAGPLHAAVRIADEGVGLAVTLTVLLVTVAGGRFVLASWLALAGVGLLITSALATGLHAGDRVAAGFLLAGTTVILVVHVEHTARLLTRRFARLLRDERTRGVILTLLIALLALVMASLLLETPDARPPFIASVMWCA